MIEDSEELGPPRDLFRREDSRTAMERSRSTQPLKGSSRELSPGHTHRARIISPLPLRVAKTGRNHLNEEFTPLLPTVIGERF